jgi:hypothetical protein
MNHWVCGASATSIQVKEKVMASATHEPSPIRQGGKQTPPAGAAMIPSASIQSVGASVSSTGGAAVQTAGVVMGVAGGLVGAFAVFL